MFFFFIFYLICNKLLAEACGGLSATGLGCFVDALSVSHFFDGVPTAGTIQSFYHFVVGSYHLY